MKTLVVYTAYKKRFGRMPNFIDVTVKSGSVDGRPFIPSTTGNMSEIVWPHQQGQITDWEYLRSYAWMIENRLVANPDCMSHLFDRGEIILGCYCDSAKFCHRYYAAWVLIQVARQHGYNAYYGGEMPTQKIASTTSAGSLIDVTDGIVVDQRNCIPVMGAGLALQIAKKYPHVVSAYKSMFSGYTDVDKYKLLGELSVCYASPGVVSVGLMGQYYIWSKRDPKDSVYTDYLALHAGLLKIRHLMMLKEYRNYKCYFPIGMGSSLGGGNWELVKALIEFYINDAVFVNYKKWR